MEVYEHDPDLREAFSYAGRGSFDDSLLDEIEQHTFTVYVIADVKGYKGLKEVLDVGEALLKAGGMAVKIEISGIAHTRDEWLELVQNQDYFPIYSSFVTLLGDDECYYSCGMKAFGLRDVITPSSLSPEDAAELINNFNLYSLVEKVTFNSGETFSLGESSPLCKVELIDDYKYEEDDIFFNPFGLVALVAV
ncbi:DUF4261 domain-containing protein [Sutcliffiella horikoshii]|uniref:DUF4261 domain-containing protein n=1 Tax=Sutcliffiella horikoshii TaxID=79883 RepID=UPI0021CC89E9|nr:DUF4261 domain-containing protein [Sutcliffiella horikoshii]